jgi:ABC-type transport system involved in multi-copper enzyme maturation permease subunit
MLETAQQLASAPRSTGSALTHTMRLVRWELFLARRRALAKVLAIILLVGYLLAVGFILASYAVASSNGAVDLELQPVRDLLTFPNSLLVGGIYSARLAPLLVCVLAGAVIGGEYGYSTQRLAFSRGVGRGQMLAAQVAALGLISLGTSVAMMALSALTGVLLGPAVGGIITGPGQDGWREVGAYTLVLSLILWVYALLAAFFATLGRSVAAGIGISLGWLFIEGIIASIFQGLGFLPGSFFKFLGHIPDWFLGVNTSALKITTSSAPLNFSFLDAPPGTSALGFGATTLSLAHALAVVVAYAVVFVAVSYLLLRSRDITD